MKQHTAAGLLALGAAAVAHEAAAQQAVVRRAPPVEQIGSDAEDRARLAQLRGGAPLDGFLLRSPSSRAAPLAAAPGDVQSDTTLLVAPWWPEVTVVHNSALPFTLNDGAMWAGRGTSTTITGGIRARRGRLHVTIAPTLVYAQNSDFPLPTDPRIAPTIPPARSPYSYPWRVYGASIDYPLRFGADPYTRLDFGQSSAYMTLGAVDAGISTENEWWGPGIRNALVLSNNAPGIPRLFVRTAQPLQTALGAVEGRYVLGTLATSPYFETSSYPDRGRSFSAAAVTLRPAAVPTLSLGATRAVYAQTTDGFGSILLHAFDVVSVIGRPNARPQTDPAQRPGRDQVYSLFARWVLPDDGFESYVEWGRTEFPENLRDLLVAPNHTQGYTLGFQYARPLGAAAGTTARLQAEMSNVAQSSTYRQRPTGSWYTSRAVVQGYTQRGQVIGSAIGPGGSSQWLAGDVIAGGWSAGLFAGRIRWDDDAHYSVELPNGGFCRHDVTVTGGVRGSARLRVGTLTASLGASNRLNTFFQNTGICFADRGARVDTRNTTLSLSFAPRS